tara:strand:+ start:1530 stop:1877 length:348 start_codon:yes stop_codon:yes gene_type:complete
MTKLIYKGTDLGLEINELNEIQNDLSKLVLLQNDPLLRIEDHLEKSELLLTKAHNDLQIANQYYKDRNVILIGGIIGSLLCTPIGILLGTKIGATTLIGGALLGSYGGYKAQQIK